MRSYNNFDLTNYNSYRLNSICKNAYFPENEEEFINLYFQNKSFVLLGSGHNVILSKAYYDDDFIIFNGNYNNYTISTDGLIEAQSGVSMMELSILALNNGFTGLEVFYDIPSSLGGAVVMNAGANGEEIKDVLVKVRYFDLATKEIKEISKNEMGFEYRNSFFQRNKDKIVLKSWIQLKKLDKNDIKEKMETIKFQRWQKQPKDFPNAGSVFKRPQGYFVGSIIDELSLKGFSIGGAKVSEKHGGFIINYNNCSGEDIIKLISHIQEKAQIKYNINLEVEQRII